MAQNGIVRHGLLRKDRVPTRLAAQRRDRKISDHSITPGTHVQCAEPLIIREQNESTAGCRRDTIDGPIAVPFIKAAAPNDVLVFRHSGFLDVETSIAICEKCTPTVIAPPARAHL